MREQQTRNTKSETNSKSQMTMIETTQAIPRASSSTSLPSTLLRIEDRTGKLQRTTVNGVMVKQIENWQLKIGKGHLEIFKFQGTQMRKAKNIKQLSPKSPVRFGTNSYKSVRSRTFRYVLVRFGTFWYVLVRFGTFSYTEVRFGTFRYAAKICEDSEQGCGRV